MIFLHRSCFPTKWDRAIRFFDRSEGNMSTIFTQFLEFIHSRICQWQLLDFLPRRFQALLPFYSDAVKRAGAPFANVVGFIDGTGRQICRPSIFQEIMFSGKA